MRPWSAAARRRRKPKEASPSGSKPAPESHLQEQTSSLFAQLGYRGFHVLNMVGSAAGWPDLYELHRARSRYVIAELKREGEEPTPDQVEYLTDFVEVALGRGEGRPPVFLWYPRHLDSGAIVRIAQYDNWPSKFAQRTTEDTGEWMFHPLYEAEKRGDQDWLLRKEKWRAQRKESRRRARRKETR